MKLSSALLTAVFSTFTLSAFSEGKQVGGARTPAANPAPSPAEAQKKFTVPAGYEVRLFASEPMLVNPVAMTWDARGRLWVVELLEYPLGAKKGEKPRDQVKILEDTDGDGLADKSTVFADGLNLATAITLGDGGAYIGQAPDMLFFKDTDGDDKADERTVVLTGFGLEDRHELVNGFTWGPDGWLYMTHGVFTHSKVRQPDAPATEGVTLNAGLGRYHPRTKKFEVFADGTSNPWGVDFDAAGQAFVSACVIDHMFHLAAGGIYVRQGGSPAFPYSYSLLPSIVNHKHFRAAYAGVDVYGGDQYPADMRGQILIGNIHDNAVHQERLLPACSSFKAEPVRDFVRANDGWFRPVSTQTGPDGAVWIMDWSDKYPCYQNAQADPEGVDRAFGRIWRVVYTGSEPGKAIPAVPAKLNLDKLSSMELVKELTHANDWRRRMAQRLLSEKRDPAAQVELEALFKSGAAMEIRLAALWTLHGSDQLTSAVLTLASSDKEPALRHWAARLIGERGKADEATPLLVVLGRDEDATVRQAVAVALRQFASGSLTVDTKPDAERARLDFGKFIPRMLRKDFDADATLAHSIWMVLEPLIVADPNNTLMQIIASAEDGNNPTALLMVEKAAHRISDLRNYQSLDDEVQILAMSDNNAVIAAGLRGLLASQRNGISGPVTTAALFERIKETNDEKLADLALQLGTLWGDAGAITQIMASILDAKAPVQNRILALQAARKIKSPAVSEGLGKLLQSDLPDELLVEAARSAAQVGDDSYPDLLLARWAKAKPNSRTVLAEALTSRPKWAVKLLDGVETKVVSASDLPISVRRFFSQQADAALKTRSEKLIGKFVDLDQNTVATLAAKRKIVLAGTPDMEAGRKIAEATCFVCHQFHGKGIAVGPDLTGSGRSNLDALLANVVFPNQIIGNGYENWVVTTKDGRFLSGRMIEDAPDHLKLLAIVGREESVPTEQVATKTNTEQSLMPMGFGELPEADFRNLIWFILNPPEDKRPMTDELRNELLNTAGAPGTPVSEAPAASTKSKAEMDAKIPATVDWESIANWAPTWKVDAPEFEKTPVKMPDYLDRKNVLITHPFDKEKPAGIESELTVPAAGKPTLRVSAAAHEKGDWILRLLVNGEEAQQQVIDAKQPPRWKDLSFDLSPWAGKTVKVRLENAANGWTYEFGYWADLKMETEL